MHAFVAASPACAFQTMTASPPAGAANRGSRQRSRRPGELGEYAGHKGGNEKYPWLYCASHTSSFWCQTYTLIAFR